MAVEMMKIKTMKAMMTMKRKKTTTMWLAIRKGFRLACAVCFGSKKKAFFPMEYRVFGMHWSC